MLPTLMLTWNRTASDFKIHALLASGGPVPPPYMAHFHVLLFKSSIISRPRSLVKWEFSIFFSLEKTWCHASMFEDSTNKGIIIMIIIRRRRRRLYNRCGIEYASNTNPHIKITCINTRQSASGVHYSYGFYYYY